VSRLYVTIDTVPKKDDPFRGNRLGTGLSFSKIGLAGASPRSQLATESEPMNRALSSGLTVKNYFDISSESPPSGHYDLQEA
jgi:hypothetical protein